MEKKENANTAGQRRLPAGNSSGGDEKVPKGYVPMLVGYSGRERERVLVHRKHFGHPDFAVLLEMAANEFGYEQQGILQIPCDVEFFKRLVEQISKKK